IDGVMRRFHVDDPDLWLKATENIGNIIGFIQGLIDKGHAYATGDGNVYFDVDTYPAYGHLSGRNLQDALDGVRVDNDENKKNAYDFALWKAAKEGEIFWDSPWGKGRPGWHIECSAMNRAAFGEQIDLHGGGRDLIFPHHENEIAQTESLTGKRFVKYWTHNGLIKVNGQKMSKSLGNSLLLSDLLDKYSDEAVKFALLQTNYRGDINITDDLFPEAEKHIREFYLTLLQADVAKRGGLVPAKDDAAFAMKADEAFDKAMDDDFNTALALSDLFGLFKETRAYLAKNDAKGVALADQIKKTYALLGLFEKTPEEYLAWYDEKHEENIPAEAVAIAEERKAARANKDWKKSDELRAKLAAMGYAVKDTKDGYELQKA
ncbi:MAG: cysteine--tRNA ligase, partial [Candidatus Scatosoma sp.]